MEDHEQHQCCAEHRGESELTLLRALAAERERAEKAEHSARNFCGAHIGKRYAECPVCRAVGLDDRVNELEEVVTAFEARERADREAQRADARGDDWQAARVALGSPMGEGVIEGIRRVLAEGEKFAFSARQFCGEHTGQKFPGCPACRTKRAEDELKAHRNLATLHGNAYERARQRWHAAHPGRETTWPDTSDLVLWIMDQLTAAEARERRMRKLAMAVANKLEAELRVLHGSGGGSIHPARVLAFEHDMESVHALRAALAQPEEPR